MIALSMWYLLSKEGDGATTVLSRSFLLGKLHTFYFFVFCDLESVTSAQNSFKVMQMNAIKVWLIILHSSDGILLDREVCLLYVEGQNKVKFYYIK